MRYVIKDRPGDDGIVLEYVAPQAIVARINALSGRDIGAYITTTAIPENRRRTGRESAYVAVDARQVRTRDVYGRGFIVEVVR